MALALWVALAAAPRAAAAPAAGPPGVPTLLAREDVVAKMARDKRAEKALKGGRFDAPGWVMMRSLAVPGWGQFHNRAWLKALGVATGEIWMGLRLLDDRGTLNDLEGEVNRIGDVLNGLPADDPSIPGLNDRRNALVDDYNSRLEGYTGRQWLLGGIVAYALLDAYVDAHFRGFNIEFEADPALEGGDDVKLRVGLRREF